MRFGRGRELLETIRREPGKVASESCFERDPRPPGVKILHGGDGEEK